MSQEKKTDQPDCGSEYELVSHKPKSSPKDADQFWAAREGKPTPPIPMPRPRHLGPDGKPKPTSDDEPA